MPAITADTLALSRVSAPGPIDTERPVRSITTGPRGHEGEGFPVVRAFAGVSSAALDPFVHMDQMGEVEYQPGEPRGTDWHPHRGFETVTYMIDGRFAHQDSHGGGGLIADGATQWMTAGSGILHIETPPAELVESGGMFHGIQLWVNLPKKDKRIPPRYQDTPSSKIPVVTSADKKVRVKVIAGESLGAMYVDYAVATVAFLIAWFILDFTTHLSDPVQIAIVGFIAVASILIFYPTSRSVWTVLVYLSGGIEKPRIRAIRGGKAL